MTDTTICAREYKFGSRYYRVSVAVYVPFVPVPFPGVEITLHRSSWLVRRQGKKRIVTVNLSWDRQALFSEKYSRTVWEGPQKMWNGLRSLMSSAVTQVALHTLRKWVNVMIILSDSYLYYSPVTGWWLGESESPPFGREYGSETFVDSGGRKVVIIRRPGLGFWLPGTLLRFCARVVLAAKSDGSSGRTLPDG